MKKFIVFFIVVFVSCGEQRQEVFFEKEEKIVVKDTAFMDSLISKATELIISTQDSHKKIERINQISKENVSLKKELKETKQELNSAKLELVKLDSLTKPKKRNFIQKIVDNFKDTVK